MATQASQATGGPSRGPEPMVGRRTEARQTAEEISSLAAGCGGTSPGRGKLTSLCTPVQPPGPQPSFLAGHLTPLSALAAPPVRLGS